MKRYAWMLAAALVALAPSAGSLARAEGGASLAPLFSASEGWINGPVTPRALQGKVVLVDVFTFGCINCKNVTPNLRALERRDAKDLAIVGIHSPETDYERDRANVESNLKAQGVVWPVAIDNGFALWRAYGVDAWPTELIFDRKGHLRQTIVGDSQDALVDRTIETLIAEK